MFKTWFENYHKTINSIHLEEIQLHQRHLRIFVTIYIFNQPQPHATTPTFDQLFITRCHDLNKFETSRFNDSTAVSDFPCKWFPKRFFIIKCVQECSFFHAYRNVFELIDCFNRYQFPYSLYYAIIYSYILTFQCLTFTYGRFPGFF